MNDESLDSALRGFDDLSPIEQLRRIAEVRASMGETDRIVRGILRNVIVEIREQEPRPTWSEIGKILDVSPQRAEQLSK